MTTEPSSRLSEDEQKALAHCIPGSNRAREPFGWDANTKAAIAEVEHILSGRLAPRVTSVAIFAAGVDALLTAAPDNGESFRCPEAEAIAALIRLYDHESAESFLDYHAAGDEDEDDLHHDRLCSECRSNRAEDHSMCGSCLHDAERSGWTPGTEET